jgi:midasin
MKYVATRVYQDFVDIFAATFSRKQNAEFLSFASAALKKEQWKKLSQCFCRAAKLGLTKVNESTDNAGQKLPSRKMWNDFQNAAERFEQQRIACNSGMAFVFTEGVLVDAVRKGKWILLDEINLASSETLMRLCGLLDDPSGSLTLTERGDTVAIERHDDFRLFSAMNPATDAGKKDLNPSIRSRFTEIYVGEVVDPLELRIIAGRYISDILPGNGCLAQDSDLVIGAIDVYLTCRDLALNILADGNGQRPRYTLRTLTRAMMATRTLVREQKISLQRAVYEGFELAFQGPLDSSSALLLVKTLSRGFDVSSKLNMDHPGRRLGSSDDYALVNSFWLRSGPLDRVDWSQANESTAPRFILTPSVVSNLRRLARAVAAGPWPVLLEGPTSAG